MLNDINKNSREAMLARELKDEEIIEEIKNRKPIEDKHTRDKINICYFNLTSFIIQSCFAPSYGETAISYDGRRTICKKKRGRKERFINSVFASSKMIDLFCDCSYNFESSRLRDKIIKHNSKD